MTSKLFQYIYFKGSIIEVKQTESFFMLIWELIDQPSCYLRNFEQIIFEILTGMLYNYCLFSVHVYRTCSLYTALWQRMILIKLQHWLCLEMHDGSPLSPENRYERQNSVNKRDFLLNKNILSEVLYE